MRFLCWCSAALVLLAGLRRADRRRARSVRLRPRAVRSPSATPASRSPGRRSPCTSSRSRAPGGSTRSSSCRGAGGRHPAVLFLHGSGGNREDLLLPAIELASRGVVDDDDLAAERRVDVPAARRQRAACARRARRAAATSTASELGLVGFSLGAQTAAILAGDEPRLKAVGILSGRGEPVPRHWIRQAHAPLFFQAGRSERRSCRARGSSADRRRARSAARALVRRRARPEPARLRRPGRLAGRPVGPQVAFRAAWRRLTPSGAWMPTRLRTA